MRPASASKSPLELYSIMGEYDNAGFPLSYCLLSTASAMHIHKRTNALKAWAECLRDKYGVIPRFAHTDKDMAEIGMLRGVWVLKVQLCWWHNVARARSEFPWIDQSFIPTGKPDTSEYEGGISDELEGADLGNLPSHNHCKADLPWLTARIHSPTAPLFHLW